MYIFLVALAMLFIAGTLGYVLIRTNWGTETLGTIQLPKTLFISTVLMLAASVTIHLAMNAIRQERRDAFRTFLTSTIVFAGLFLVVQSPAMYDLYQRHRALESNYAAEQLANPATQPSIDLQARNAPHDAIIARMRPVPYYALVMIMILIHALHVVGGIVSLGMVAYNGFHDKYDHEDYTGVRNCVLYWHFLDAIWIFMFVVIAAFG